MSYADCDFCLEFAGQTTWLSHILEKEGLSSRIVLRRKGVVSLTGLGPLTAGHLLVLPEKHYYSVGETPEAILHEIALQKSQITSIIRRAFGSVICYEHGAISDTRRGGACIDHAHLHIIPGCQGFKELVSMDFTETPVASLDDLKALANEGVPYLFVEDLDQQAYIYRVPDRIPSQYLRQIWARALGKPDEWDWGAFPNYSLMKETFYLMHEIQADHILRQV